MDTFSQNESEVKNDSESGRQRIKGRNGNVLEKMANGHYRIINDYNTMWTFIKENGAWNLYLNDSKKPCERTRTLHELVERFIW